MQNSFSCFNCCVQRSLLLQHRINCRAKNFNLFEISRRRWLLKEEGLDSYKNALIAE